MLRTRHIAVLLATSVALAMLPGFAMAAAPKSKTATDTFKLDFTLPTYGKSGCTVCHADPNLVRLSADTTVSLFVDPELMALGPHKETLCTGCHIDFAYKTPHEVGNGESWRAVAKLQCASCHEQQAADQARSAHSSAVRPGKQPAKPATGTIDVPLCGDCHGGHDVISSAEMTSSAAFKTSGIVMCGGECHEEYTTNYRDYYHGAAYQAGAPDAPACWDCHTAHMPLPKESRQSSIHENNLDETCGQEGCHTDVDETFLEYAPFIHYRTESQESVAVWSAYQKTRQIIDGALGTVKSWFGS